MIEDLYLLAEQKAQDIGVTSNEDVELQANDTDLYLLIKTLADNAIRYTPAGSQIDLSVQQTADNVILCVEDNGNGIPAAERQRVLEPFYRILGSDQQALVWAWRLPLILCRTTTAVSNSVIVHILRVDYW